MTRLIDADALLPMMRYATIDSEIGVFPIKIGFEEIVRVIDDAPTVDAIPIEFVEKEAEKMRMSENPAIRINSVILTVLIKKWREKQNETV